MPYKIVKRNSRSASSRVGLRNALVRYGTYKAGQLAGAGLRYVAKRAARGFVRTVKNRFRGRTRTRNNRYRGPTTRFAYGHNDQSIKKFKLFLGRAKKCRRSRYGTIKIINTTNAIVTANEGAQAYGTLKCMNSIGQIIDKTTSRNNRYLDATAWMDMLPNNANSTQGGLSYISDSTKSTISYLNIENAHSTMQVVNMENASCTVWVYFFLCINNTRFNPTDIWANDLFDDAQGKSPSVVTTTTANTWATGRVDPSFLGQYPNTRNIKKYYKLLTCQKFLLDGGGSKRLEYDTIINKTVNDEELQDAYQSSSQYFYKNLTVVPVIVAQGAPVGINDTAASTIASEVTTAPLKIGIVQQDKIRISCPPEPSPFPIQAANYGIVTSGSPHVYGPRIINDEDALASIIRV